MPLNEGVALNGGLPVKADLRLIIVLALGLAGIVPIHANPPIKGTQKSPAKKSPPVLKEIDANPQSYLGQLLTIDAWITNQSKPSDGAAELAILVNANGPATRLRFLAESSFIQELAEYATPHRARLKGTILAPESIRSAYIFEVEEVEVLDEWDEPLKVLKSKSGVMPPPIAEGHSNEAASHRDAAKSTDATKKSGVPTLLIVGASVMAALLMTLSVIGLRLVKYMKKNPPTNRARGPNVSPRVDVFASKDYR